MMKNYYQNDIKVNEGELKDEEDEEEIPPDHYDLLVYPADYTVNGLFQLQVDDSIILPTFQRQYVWDIKRASELIESIMLELPIPPVFFYRDPDSKFLVIDGWQRLQSIFYFKNGYFGNADRAGRQKIFSIKGISKKSPLFGQTYESFNNTQKRKFDNYVLRSTIIKQLDPEGDQSMYQIFRRLNAGGVALQDQEIRNCVYDGELNELLKKLNEHDSWRKILGKENPDRRQKDIGYLLRCLALLHNHSQYQKPMREFLSQFMKKNKNPSPDFLKEEEEKFKKTCNRIVQTLGEKPFHPIRTLSPSMLDSIFVAFAQNLDHDTKNLKSNFNKLLDNKDFREAISNSTTDTDVVCDRLNLAKTILFG